VDPSALELPFNDPNGIWLSAGSGFWNAAIVAALDRVLADPAGRAESISAIRF
jgi:hypothetical protein